MTKFRIFVDFSGSDLAIQLLRDETKSHELIFAKKPGDSVLSEAGADSQIVDADIAFGQPVPKSIEIAQKLKWIQVSSSGITRYDNVRFRSLVTSRNIAVCNSAMVYEEPCAVHALSFMLAQTRHLPLALASRVQNGSPEWHALRHTCSKLYGENVLIVGFGAIGRRLTELLRPFDVKITAYRRKARGDEPVPIVSETELPKALAEAQHVIDILPDSAETRHFFNASRFSQMKPGAVFYNIGRGATVGQEALLATLRSGHLAAAWLDVTEPEPLPEGHPLLGVPNCFITPHIAGGHENEACTLVRHFIKNLRRFEQGELLFDRVM